MEQRDDRLDIREFAGRQSRGESLFISETTIFCCVEGWASVLIDGFSSRFEKGTNFIAIDSVNLCIEECSDDFRYKAIVFGRKAFNRIYTHIDITVIGALKSSAPDLCPLEGFRQSELTLDKIMLLNESDAEHRRLIMRNLIFCYIYEVYEIVRNRTTVRPVDSSKFVDTLISRFVILCRENHSSHRDLSFYSDSLSISRRYLHTIVVSKMHVTPKQFIDGYVITAAKRMLLETTKTAEQISEELNFADQSTFGQFFRRITKLSPRQFRSQALESLK